MRESPIAFAHRGASAHARENTLEAFRLALRLGANGLESDAWSTLDGDAALDHDGLVRAGLRRRSIGDLERSSLPSHIPTLADLLDELGGAFHLSLDLKDTAVSRAIGETVHARLFPMERLWLCSPDIDVLTRAGEVVPGARLVHSTRLSRMRDGCERHCAMLRDAGVAALNLHHSEWNGGNVVLAHRFGLHAFAWDVQHREHMDGVLSMGMDAVYSDHVDMMNEAFIHSVGRPQTPS